MAWKVVEQVIIDGKRAGFDIKDNKGTKRLYKDSQVRTMIKNGVEINITYDRRGSRLNVEKELNILETAKRRLELSDILSV